MLRALRAVGRTWIVVLTASPLAATGASGTTQQRPVYASDVDLVTLAVAVLDPGNEPITDLNERDFTILENGIEKPVAMLLRPGETPLDVAMLIDLSNSMRRRGWRNQTEAFLDALGQDDCVFLLGFSTEVGGSVWGGPRDDNLREAVADAQAYGGTAFHDAVLVGITEMDRSAATRTLRGSTRSALNPEMLRGPALRSAASGDCPKVGDGGGPRRRRALVVVSDGVDSASRADLDDVRVAAQLSGLPIFPIRIGDAGPGRRPDWPTTMGNGPEILAELARITGGRTVAANDEGYAEIVSWLRGSYLLGYYASNPRGLSRLQIDRRDIVVRVDRPNARVLHRPTHFREAVDSAAARSWVAEAQRFLEEGGLEPAIAALDRAIAADPTHAPAWFERGLLLAQQGKLEAAREDAAQAASTGPGVVAHHELAMLLALDLGEGAEAWTQAIRAAQAGGDLERHRARLESVAAAPPDLEQQLAAPRIAVARPYMDSTNRLMESALDVVSLAIGQQLAAAPGAALVSDPTRAQFVVTVHGLAIDMSPQKLRVRVDLSARGGERLRSEVLEFVDLGTASAVAATLRAAVERTVQAAGRHH